MLFQIFNKGLGDYITSYHSELILEGPVWELMVCPITKSGMPNEIIKIEDGWKQFCEYNDVLKFTFFDIANSSRDDVDKVTN
jgi:hypothetical protein